MTTILGLDISSFQLNACLLVDGQAPVLRTEIIGKPSKDALVDRLGRIPAAMVNILQAVRPDVDFIVVEEPFGGKNIPKALLMTAGAVLACVEEPTRPWLITPLDWRRAIGAKNTKVDGHLKVEKYLLRETKWAPFDLDEHELDAIGIALGARAILEGQVAA